MSVALEASNQLKTAKHSGLRLKQYAVLKAISDLLIANPWPPSFVEIAANSGVSVGTVFNSVRELETLGWIRRQRGKYRSLELLRKVPARSEVVTA